MGQLAPSSLPPELERHRLIGKQELAVLLDVHWASISRLVAEKRIPPGIRLSGKKLGWRLGVILDLIAEHEAAPRTQQARWAELAARGQAGLATKRAEMAR